jgi:hypothetical protein
MRCVQLAAIERTAAGAALVAGVKAKNLDASAVDILRIVKVRCRRRAPWSVRECPSGPPEYAGTLEYPEHPRVSLSTVGTPQQAGVPLVMCAGVFHSIVECSSVRSTLLKSLPWSTLRVPWSTREYG